MAIPNLSSFDAWWESDGKFYDPDWSDVPWYDKRKSLAEYAWHRAVAAAPLPARTKLLNIAARVARREYLPSLEKCRTINDARLEVGRYDERHATLAMDLKAVFDEFRAAAHSRGMTVHNVGCPCGFCKAGFTKTYSTCVADCTDGFHGYGCPKDGDPIEL